MNFTHQEMQLYLSQQIEQRKPLFRYITEQIANISDYRLIILHGSFLINDFSDIDLFCVSDNATTLEFKKEFSFPNEIDITYSTRDFFNRNLNDNNFITLNIMRFGVVLKNDMKYKFNQQVLANQTNYFLSIANKMLLNKKGGSRSFSEFRVFRMIFSLITNAFYNVEYNDILFFPFITSYVKNSNFFNSFLTRIIDVIDNKEDVFVDKQLWNDLLKYYNKIEQIIREGKL